MCIYWSHLFGNNKDDLHYSKFFSRPDVLAVGQQYSKESVKKRILNAINYDDKRYKAFWKEVKCCRDKFIAHREVEAKGIYPNIVICRLMAEELRVILSELIEECSQKSPENEELFWLRYSFSLRNNKWLYNKCRILYNKRTEDSCDL